MNSEEAMKEFWKIQKVFSQLNPSEYTCVLFIDGLMELLVILYAASSEEMIREDDIFYEPPSWYEEEEKFYVNCCSATHETFITLIQRLGIYEKYEKAIKRSS